MGYFARISNGVVIGIAVSDSCPDVEGEWVDVSSHDKRPGPEWLYNDGQFSAPVKPPEPRIITKLSMINRFTESEYMAVLSVAKTDIAVEAWLNKFNLQVRFDLDSDGVKNQINFLVSKVLLTAERANEILNNQIEFKERI